MREYESHGIKLPNRIVSMMIVAFGVAATGVGVSSVVASGTPAAVVAPSGVRVELTSRSPATRMPVGHRLRPAGRRPRPRGVEWAGGDMAGTCMTGPGWRGSACRRSPASSRSAYVDRPGHRRTSTAIAAVTLFRGR